MPVWSAARTFDPAGLGGVARRIWESLQQGGAMFTVELAQRTGLLQTQLEQGLAELVAQGLISADAFSPLRWLIRPEVEKQRVQKKLSRRRRHAVGGPGAGLLGRWSVVREGPAAAPGAVDSELFPDQARLAAVCESLLLRYGVVFRAVLERESLAPPWRLLLRYLRRMEDRGEVHGGRFVDGFSGEQFALPEAVGLLRNVRGDQNARQLAVISAADPLNLGGIITAGARTAARPGSRILLLNGVQAARIQGEELQLIGGESQVSPAEAERYLRAVRSFPGVRSDPMREKTAGTGAERSGDNA
jgi:ATP-dependent Lhr-like helicase